MRVKRLLAFGLVTILSASLVSGVFVGKVFAFNNNDVLSDQVLDDYKTMTASQINSFLNKYPSSCISTNSGFKAVNPIGYNPSDGYLYGSLVTAGTIIYNAAQAYEINPQVLLATLQKEQSLVSGGGGCSTKTISKAMGYGCPDSHTYNSYTGVKLYSRNGTNYTSVSDICVNSKSKVGFSQQIIHAAWLLKYTRERAEGKIDWAIIKGNWDNSDDLNATYSGYMTEGCFKRSKYESVCTNYDGYATIDGKSVHMDNGATAALYRYTPHFSGNQHFVTIFTDTFGFGPTTIKDSYKFERLAGPNPAVLPTTSTDLADYTATLTIGNQIQVFYYDSTNHCLRHAWWNGKNWSQEILDGAGSSVNGHSTNDVGSGIAAMRLGQSGIQLYYYDATGGNLRHAWWNGKNWGFENLDGSGTGSGRVNANVGQTPAVTTYGTSGIQLYYYDATGGNLRHAWWNGKNWGFENLDGSGTGSGRVNANVGQTPAVTTYGTSGIQLYYYDATGGNLRHAWWNGKNWGFENLDGTPTSIGGKNYDLGKSPAVTLFNGNLQLFYYEVTNGNLRHAWWGDNQWHFENLDGDIGSVIGNNSNVGNKVVVKPFQNDLFIFYYDSVASAWQVAYSSKGWHAYPFDGVIGSVSGSSTAVAGQLSFGVYNGDSLQIYYQGNGGDLRHAWAKR